MSKPIDQEREAFAREGRYIVIKRSDLIAADKEGRVSHEIFDSLEAVAGIVPRRECLVIEGDWPEYEKAWAMIEARMTGKQPASVAVPDVDWVMHLLADRWPESAERVEVELFAEWLREVLAADPHPVSESAEDRFEHYLQNAIDNAPDPLRRLGEYLSHVIDEDEWATAERMLNGAIVAASAHPVSGEQKPPTVQITGHLDEVDAPVWEFINAQARQLGPATGSIDTYNFARPNGAQPNGVVVVLWNGNSIHAMAVTVRDSMNRTQCVRLLAAPPAAQDVFELRLCEQKHTVLKPGVVYLFTVDPNCAACVELDSARRAQQGEQP